MDPTDPNPDWHLRADCRGKPIDLFFSEAKKTRAYVRGLCAACPVQRDCLEASLREDETYRLIPFGYRGGADPAERRAMLQARTTTNTARSAA